jgi:hypothetical protein
MRDEQARQADVTLRDGMKFRTLQQRGPFTLKLQPSRTWVCGDVTYDEDYAKAAFAEGRWVEIEEPTPNTAHAFDGQFFKDGGCDPAFGNWSLRWEEGSYRAWWVDRIHGLTSGLLYSAKCVEGYVRNGRWIPITENEAAAMNAARMTAAHSPAAAAPPTQASCPAEQLVPEKTDELIELTRLLGEPEGSLLAAAAREIESLRKCRTDLRTVVDRVNRRYSTLHTERVKLADRCGQLENQLKDKRAECDELRDRLNRLDRSPTPRK